MEICNRVTDGPLIKTDWCNRVMNFYSMDTEERYIKHSHESRLRGEHWDYFNKSITYRFNSHGYRTVELSDIDWKEAVVVFGCSHVVGEGLAEEDTITAQLSKLLQRPVVNLGVSGTGMLFSFYNSVMLYKNLPTPYAVVQLWSNVNRIELYTNDGVLLNTPHTKSNNEFYRNWLQHPENSNTYMYMTAQASRCLWESKTTYYELSLFTNTRDVLNCTHIHAVDYARDQGHPGIETAKLIADNIAANIT
jgi:hypothetical protein